MPEPARIHVRERVLSCELSPVDVAALLANRPGGTEIMLVEGAPVADRATALVASGALLRYEVTGGNGRRDLLHGLFEMLGGLRFDGPALTPTLRSMFGFLSYEAARCFETLPERHQRRLPDCTYFLPQVVVAVSIPDNLAQVVGYGATPGAAEDAVAAAARTIASSPPGHPPTARTTAPVRAWLDRAGYESAVRRAKQYLLDGDIFQVVLSLRWQVDGDFDGLRIYRRLGALNPSPFQFWYQGPKFAAVGASPEPFVTVTGDRARLRPLAGTRARCTDPAADRAAERELLASVKDGAEHRMLVDLARNDLGRVCRPGTVEVDELMSVERYSHVMHLVSNVVGQLPLEVNRHRALRACFPAGTMTGAPKIRAMEIIDELEPAARGLYSGAVGLLATDEIHTYLTIRAVEIQGGTASLQAGAGIVHDSEPAAEYDECVAKLRAAAAALEIEAR